MKRLAKTRRKQRRSPWTPFTRGRIIDGTGDPRIDTKETWVNNKYQVFVYRPSFPGMGDVEMVHLSIKLNTREVIRDWRDLQRIKNELCGTACEAVEIFPAEDRLADAANQYHLWVLEPHRRFPFGFDDGRVVKDVVNPATIESYGLKNRARQRPFEDHHRAIDCPQVGPVWDGL